MIAIAGNVAYKMGLVMVVTGILSLVPADQPAPLFASFILAAGIVIFGTSIVGVLGGETA